MIGHYEEATRELLEVLRRFEGKRLFIGVLGSPDPDGLASAWALSRIASTVGVGADILTFEVLSRPDNAAFVQLLGIPFRRVQARLPRVAYAGYAVVDRQNARLPVPHRLELVVHIDHHGPSRTRALFSQQIREAGATCTIMAHHFMNVLDRLPNDNDEPCRIATALMYGIRTDTMDLLNAGALDFEAAARLAPLVSSELIRTIANTPYGKAFQQTLASALQHMVSKKGLVVAWAGRVARQARDTLGQTADFLIRGEGTNTCVVFGVVNGSVVGSLRSNDSGLDPGGFLEKALAPGLHHPVDCGGRLFSGGFTIPLDALPSSDLEHIRTTILELLFKAWKASPARRS